MLEILSPLLERVKVNLFFFPDTSMYVTCMHTFRFHRLYTLSCVAREKLVSNSVSTCVNIFKLLVVKPIIIDGFLSEVMHRENNILI